MLSRASPSPSFPRCFIMTHTQTHTHSREHSITIARHFTRHSRRDERDNIKKMSRGFLEKDVSQLVADRLRERSRFAYPRTCRGNVLRRNERRALRLTVQGSRINTTTLSTAHCIHQVLNTEGCLQVIVNFSRKYFICY